MLYSLAAVADRGLFSYISSLFPTEFPLKKPSPRLFHFALPPPPPPPPNERQFRLEKKRKKAKNWNNKKNSPGLIQYTRKIYWIGARHAFGAIQFRFRKFFFFTKRSFFFQIFFRFSRNRETHPHALEKKIISNVLRNTMKKRHVLGTRFDRCCNSVSSCVFFFSLPTDFPLIFYFLRFFSSVRTFEWTRKRRDAYFGAGPSHTFARRWDQTMITRLRPSVFFTLVDGCVLCVSEKERTVFRAGPRETTR